MLLTKEIELKWNSRTKNHYVSKGYTFTKMGDTFNVKIEDLTNGSHEIVKIECDYCGSTHSRPFKDYLKVVKRDGNDVCLDCVGIERKRTNKEKYGVENPMLVLEFKEKQKQTNLKKFGVENPTQNTTIKDKAIKTMIERYGCSNASDSLELRKKREKTNITKFGGRSPFSSQKIRDKAKETMKRNGSVRTSSQQLHIHSLTGGELNHLVSNSFLDIAFPQQLIYLEYDGGGHDLQVKLGQMTADEFFKKEQRRFYFLRDLGWKEIRIICEDDKLPEDRIIVDFVNRARSFLLQKNKSRNSSVIYNTQTNIVKLNHKKKISLEEFLNDNFKSEKEVS